MPDRFSARTAPSCQATELMGLSPSPASEDIHSSPLFGPGWRRSSSFLSRWRHLARSTRRMPARCRCFWHGLNVSVALTHEPYKGVKKNLISAPLALHRMCCHGLSPGPSMVFHGAKGIVFSRHSSFFATTPAAVAAAGQWLTPPLSLVWIKHF